MNCISHLTFGVGAVPLVRLQCVWRERGSFGAGLVCLAKAQQSVSAHFGAFGVGVVRLARVRSFGADVVRLAQHSASSASHKSLISRLQLTCQVQHPF